MSMLNEGILFVFVFVIVLLVIIFEPMVVLWSLNHLFRIGIVSGFRSWFAILFLQGVLFGGFKARIGRG